MLTCPTRAEPGSHLTGALCPRIAPSPMMTRCAIANFGNGFDEPLRLKNSISLNTRGIVLNLRYRIGGWEAYKIVFFTAMRKQFCSMAL